MSHAQPNSASLLTAPPAVTVQVDWGSSLGG